MAAAVNGGASKNDKPEIKTKKKRKGKTREQMEQERQEREEEEKRQKAVYDSMQLYRQQKAARAAEGKR
jgi:hypothetical protein